MENLVQNNKSTMSSREIAELTGKPHNDILKAIRTMEPAWKKVNGGKFSLVEYIDAKGEKRPMYKLNKTECLYVATKFNDEARAKLVIRWEELEIHIRKPLTQLELVVQSALLLADQNKRIDAVESKIQEIESKATTRPEYYTIAAYARINHIEASARTCSVIGKKAASICKERGYEIGQVNDERWGFVGSYPIKVLDEVFNTPLNYNKIA